MCKNKTFFHFFLAKNKPVNTIKDYYEKLYTSKKTDEISSKEYIFDTKLDKILNDKEKLDCDGEVTDTECSEAIGNMKLNKSPGIDGLTIEFYRAFWGKLKIVLTDIYNKSYNEALMSYSQRSSILSLLFKKGDPLCLDNYLPISLLNVDLKLISHVLAQRLKKVLPKIINVDQTGYVKNRFQGLKLAVAHSPFASKFQCGPLKISSQSSTWRVKIGKNKIV
jgi:hypothetical protein